MIKLFDSLRRRGRKEISCAKTFIGFKHNQLIGIRSNYYVLPLSQGATHLARLVAFDSGLQLIENSGLTEDSAAINYLVGKFLPQLACHPHTAGIFIVAVGDESVPAEDIATTLRELGTPCEYLKINDCSDIEVAFSLAIGTANELKIMALSGLDMLKNCNLSIIYHSQPQNFDSLLVLLEGNNLSVRLHQIKESRAQELSALALDGAHVILSFTGPDDYPSGTIITPVINVAAPSELHKSMPDEFDVAADASNQEILQKIEEIFGMVKTVSESTHAVELLFPANLPILNDPDGPDEICLIPSNPILIPFLIDLAAHQAGVFLRDFHRIDLGKVRAKKILIIGTGTSSNEILPITYSDSRVRNLTVQDYGSLHGLAKVIIAEATALI